MTVLKIGGSVIYENNKIVTETVLDTVQVINKYSSTIDGIVVGGGDLARQYIEVGEKKGLTPDELDWIGINATHSNAKFVNQLLKENYSFCQNLDLISKEKVITGGTEPGHTTDAVSVMLAEKIGSDTVYSLSDIDGVYDTRDCCLENAERVDSASVNLIKSIIEDQSNSPGRSIPIDRRAVEWIQKSGVTFTMFNGTDPTNLEDALDGSDIGTTINP